MSDRNNIKRVRGNNSKGLLTRHPDDKQENMVIDRHRDAIERAFDKTNTRSKISTVQYSNGTVVQGDAASIRKMVQCVSEILFSDFIANGEDVLSTIDRVDFAVRLCCCCVAALRLWQRCVRTNCVWALTVFCRAVFNRRKPKKVSSTRFALWKSGERKTALS